MKIKIQRIDKSLPLPEYKTKGACCFDLVARTDMAIEPHGIVLIPTNIIIDVPDGYMFIVIPRSSTPKKKGLLIPHGIGVIDQDYNGPTDEVLFQAYNFTQQVVSVTKGERIAQGCIVPVVRVVFDEVLHSRISQKSRGGVGSTG
jgi:dUTP pyrophosphatase